MKRSTCGVGAYYHTTRTANTHGYPISLVGTSGNEIITIRPYPGERAIIDGGLTNHSSNYPAH